MITIILAILIIIKIIIILIGIKIMSTLWDCRPHLYYDWFVSNVHTFLITFAKQVTE